MVAIIDYNCGNLRSVENALERLGCQYVLTRDAATSKAADKVILPGVGNAAEAMANLQTTGLVPVIKKLRQPVLGICVGMQIMCRDSEEGGGVECIGIFDAHVRRLTDDPQTKVPHVGWNEIGNLNLGKCKLFNGIGLGGADSAASSAGTDRYVYFVHSYCPTLCQDTIATCVHGKTMFSAALKYENFYATQFHPEKSGAVGETILRNFISL